MGLFDFITKRWNSVNEAFVFARNILIGKKDAKALVEATEALRYCAENESIEAQYQLYALKYDSAKLNNSEIPLIWCEKAASAGHAAAQYDLGIHYLYGEGIEQDTYKAICWLEKSGEQGYFEACKTLIRLYKVGTKVRRNFVRASYWEAKLEGSSYCEINRLLPLTKDLATPEPKVEKKPLVRPIDFSNFKELFKTVEQTEVIEADKNDCFVINAGPGTGKTYTLIRKIENLVSKQNLDPTEIVVLSFTNAVVKEVKERLAYFANNGGDRSLRNVDVKTFHSFAYWLLKQANENIEDLDEWKVINLNFNKLSYDDCMVYGSQLMEKYPDIVQNWQYFIVDEIQDINHGKAQFVLSILAACVKHNVPFCFLGDSCQAIYDYLDEKNSTEVKISSEEFYEKVFRIIPQTTRFVSFNVNHRSVNSIQQQSAPIRDVILSEENTYFYGVVKEYHDKLQSIGFNEIKSFIQEHHDSKICIMERSNLNTRYISNIFTKNNIDHICALSLHKGFYPQWIGKVFGCYNEDVLTKENLKSLLLNSGFDSENIDVYWQKIKSELKQPSEIIDFKHIIYACQTHNLDGIFDEKEKSSNIIVSNIHRTKGLEYDYVIIDESFLRHRQKEMDEMKVLYVAATRAKSETFVLTDAASELGFMRSLKWCRRHYKLEKTGKNRQGKAQFKHKYVEIIQGDEISDVGPECFVMPNMSETQKIINSLKPNDQIELYFNKENELYDIVARGGKIGVMNKSFSKGVFYINKNDYPPKFDNIYIDDVFTYIGSTNDYKPKYEYDLINYNTEYSKNRIWNYIVFSGLAHAVYE